MAGDRRSESIVGFSLGCWLRIRRHCDTMTAHRLSLYKSKQDLFNTAHTSSERANEIRDVGVLVQLMRIQFCYFLRVNFVPTN